MMKNIVSSRILLMGTIALFPQAKLPALSATRLNSVYDTDATFLDKMPNLVWGIDPFEKVPGYASKSEEELLPRLEAVFYRSKNPTAMLNGDEYEVGETIGSHRINEIGRNYVLLERGTSLIELVIAQGEELSEKIEIHEHRGRSR